MTTYMLALTGDEKRAAEAAHWACFRGARLLSVSRPARDTADRAAGVAAHGPVDAVHADRAWVTRDPAALAAILLHALDIQDGAGVVMADFDSEEFAAAVLARIAALGRRVTRPGQTPRFAFVPVIRPRLARPGGTFWPMFVKRPPTAPEMA